MTNPIIPIIFIGVLYILSLFISPVTLNTPSFTPMSGDTKLRFITVGDPQGMAVTTQQVVNYIDTTDADFAVFLGDYLTIPTVNAIKTMKKPYIVVQGNHDLGNYFFYWGFHPNQYYPNVNGFQIIVPAFDYTSYNWKQVNPTTPTIVFNHGSVFSNCGLTGIYTYAFPMKNNLDKLNIRAFYNGHSHVYQKDMINGVLYISEDSLFPSERSICTDGIPRYIGYTRINLNGTVQYTRLNFNNQFVSPFP